MGIKQEVRTESRKVSVDTTSYGAQYVKSSTEGIVEQPVKDAPESGAGDDDEKPTTRSLFAGLVNKAIESGKFVPTQEEMDKFASLCEEYTILHGGANPDGDIIIGYLTESGVNNLAEAFKKVLDGEDITSVVDAMPAVEVHAVDGGVNLDDEDEEDMDEDSVNQAGADISENHSEENPDATAETEGKRRGRPSKKSVEQ